MLFFVSEGFETLARRAQTLPSPSVPDACRFPWQPKNLWSPTSGFYPCSRIPVPGHLCPLGIGEENGFRLRRSDRNGFDPS